MSATQQRAINAPCDVPDAHGACTMECATSHARYSSSTTCVHQETPNTVHGAIPQIPCTKRMLDDDSKVLLSCRQLGPLNDDDWIVLQVTFCSEPDESGIHQSLMYSRQCKEMFRIMYACNLCTAYNKKIQLTCVKMAY